MMKLTTVAITFIAGLSAAVPAIAEDASSVSIVKTAYLIQLGGGQQADFGAMPTYALDQMLIRLADAQSMANLQAWTFEEFGPVRPANKGHVAF